MNQRVVNRVTAAALAVGVGLALGACTGDGDDGGGGSSGPTGGATSSPPDAGVAVDASLGRVAGDLSRAARAETLDGVTEVVDAWVEAAYGGGYPRTDFDDAFADFTQGVRPRADEASALLTNADIGGEIEAVTFTRRTIKVDTVGQGRAAAGATARVNLEFTTTGDREATYQVKGRLLLSPAKQGWKVFGFDVRKGES